MAISKELTSLIEKLKEEDIDLRNEAAAKIVERKGEAIPAILPLLQNSDWQLRFRAADILKKIGVYLEEVYKDLDRAIEIEKDEHVLEKMLEALVEAQIVKMTELWAPKEDTSVYLEENFLEVPRFDAEETQDIVKMLKEKKIPFKRKVHLSSHHKLSNFEEKSTFFIPKAKLVEVVATIKEYLGLNKGALFTGECACCGAEVKEAESCPECKLSLACDPLQDLMWHPFVHFLMKEGLAQ